MILSFDIDGVLAGGTYIEEWDRKPSTYAELPLLDTEIPHYLASLSLDNDVFVVTSRSFNGAEAVTKAWLEQHNILQSITGLLCVQDWVSKIIMANTLKSKLHVDDDWRVIAPLCQRGVLFLGADKDNWYPWSKRHVHSARAVFSWPKLMEKIESFATLNAAMLS